MTAFSNPAERRRISLHQSDDHYYSTCDVAPPNHRAHRRGVILLASVFALAAAVAVFGGLVQGFADMGGAFDSASSLLQSASWDRFFAGLGRVTVLGAVVAAAVFFVRRRRSKSAKK